VRVNAVCESTEESVGTRVVSGVEELRWDLLRAKESTRDLVGEKGKISNVLVLQSCCSRPARRARRASQLLHAYPSQPHVRRRGPKTPCPLVATALQD
jgi:hypothetical protein